MSDQQFANVIAYASLLVSILAFGGAIVSNIRAGRVAQENLSLQHGLIESEIRQAISTTHTSLVQISTKLADLVPKEKNGKIDAEEAGKLKLLRELHEAEIQNWLNAYEDACSKYIDGKVDKRRFKKTYKNEIQNLVEAKDGVEPLVSASKPYTAIMDVYKEWYPSDTGEHD